MQVIRFKLETIKITIQNKKDNPSLSKPRRAHLAHPTPWQVGEEQVVLLPGRSRAQVPLRVSSSLRKAGLGRRRGGRGPPRCWVSVRCCRLLPCSRFPGLGEVDRVSSRDLLHCFGRGLG